MRFATIALLPLIVLGSACKSTPAEQPPAPASAPTPAAPPPAPLTFGQHHHPIRTSNPEAQKMFDQGLAQAFGFNHEAAILSFERAAELDPSAAMPLWGKAWALGPNYNLDIDDARAKAAYDALVKAQSLAAAGPEHEKAYIDALAVRYSNDLKADRAALARAFSKAMGDLSRRYPDDLDAAVIYAESLMNLTPWKLWTADGAPAANTPQIVSLLESVLLRNPNHLGANHYYIHAVEASRTPARALPSAQRLTTLSESSGHLLHMPAHIYARTGDHAAAAKANADGAAADRRYLVTAPPNGMYGMMYYPHNLHFLADSHMMQGRFADAQQAADRVAEQLAPHVAMMPMVESMVVMPVSVLLRFSKHAEVLALQPPPAERTVQRRVASLRARHRAREDRKGGGSGGREEAAHCRNRSSAGDRSIWRRRMGNRGERAQRRRVVRSMRVSPPRAESTIGRSSSGSRQSRRPINFPMTSRRCGSTLSASRLARRCWQRDAPPTPSGCSATTSQSTRETLGRCSDCRRRSPNRARTRTLRGYSKSSMTRGRTPIPS